MVEDTFNPVRRLLFTRVQPPSQQSSRTPFDRASDIHGKDISSGEVLPVFSFFIAPSHVYCDALYEEPLRIQKHSRLTCGNANNVM